MTVRRREVLTGVCATASSLAGCLRTGGSRGSSEGTALGDLTVAVTTSTYDSGLLDELHSAFESAYDVRVRTVSAGTGETLAAGERGDVDAVTAHAKPLEDEFLESGHGITRREFAVGDFVVAGPPDDPAGIGGASDARTAFERIAATEASFCSRGDNSGTHVRERAIWEESGVEPTGEWYREAGQGMGETLAQASQQGAYLLAVHANVVDVRDRFDLEVFVDGPTNGGDPALENRYSVLVVNPAIHDLVEYELAMLYVGFLTGSEGQERIAEFEIDGTQVFSPITLTGEPGFDQYVPRERSTSSETETTTEGRTVDGRTDEEPRP